MDVANSNLPFPLHMGWAKNLLLYIYIYIVGLFLLPFSFREVLGGGGGMGGEEGCILPSFV